MPFSSSPNHPFILFRSFPFSEDKVTFRCPKVHPVCPFDALLAPPSLGHCPLAHRPLWLTGSRVHVGASRGGSFPSAISSLPESPRPEPWLRLQLVQLPRVCIRFQPPPRCQALDPNGRVKPTHCHVTAPETPRTGPRQTASSPASPTCPLPAASALSGATGQTDTCGRQPSPELLACPPPLFRSH